MAQKGDAGRERARQARGQVAQARLLDAGLDVFGSLSFAELLHDVGPRRVTRELGNVSTGAFYHHFESQEAFVRALLDHTLGPRSDLVAPETVALLRELVQDETVEVLDAIVRVARSDFERQATVALPVLRFQLCAWVAHDQPDVRDALRGNYQRFTAQYTAAYEVLLARWGREIRPPFTLHTAAVILTALVEGLVLRACVDPDAAGPDLYGESVRALLPMITRATGDSRSVEEMAVRLQQFSGVPLDTPEGTEIRGRVLDSVAARFDAGTFDDATVDDIAQEAGVDAAEVYLRYLSKPGLAAATFARFVPLLERAVVADQSAGRAPVEMIRRHLSRLAEIAGRHRALTNALLDAVQRAVVRYGDRIGPTDPRAIVPLPQLVEPIIRAGQERGDVHGHFDSFDLAALATNLVLTRIMTRPRETPAASAEVVCEMVLHGITTVRGRPAS